MRIRTYLVGASLFVVGCGSAAQKPEAMSANLAATSPSKPAAEAANSQDKPDPAAPSATKEDPKEALHQADRLSMDQLSASARDDRFALDKQLGALRKSIQLYGEFIDRAGTDPQFQDEVRRSRDRIEEAKTTIAFLLSQQASP